MLWTVILLPVNAPRPQSVEVLADNATDAVHEAIDQLDLYRQRVQLIGVSRGSVVFEEPNREQISSDSNGNIF